MAHIDLTENERHKISQSTQTFSDTFVLKPDSPLWRRVISEETEFTDSELNALACAVALHAAVHEINLDNLRSKLLDAKDEEGE